MNSFVKMRTSVKLYIVVLSLCIGNLKGQTENNSSVIQQTTNIKPIRNDAYVYETSGFNNDSITSGPILVIDKKTIFISNINYDSKNDTRFWAGTGRPSSSGSLIPDENNSEGPLNSYNGQNIYLQFPRNMTTDKIDYLALWSLEKKTDLGYVMLYKDVDYNVRSNIPEAQGYHNKTADNKTIFRIPTCCRRNEIFNNCTKVDEDLASDFEVYQSNETHMDTDQLMEDIEFAPYQYYLTCKPGYQGIVLEEGTDPYGLIFNGSLIYYLDDINLGILPHGSFCFKYENISSTAVSVCISVPTTAGAKIYYFYVPFLVVSAICFFGSAITYIFIIKAKDVHRKCFVGYSLSMAFAFVALLFLQLINHACNFMGGLFMFSILSSFVWLGCLCIDLIFLVKTNNKYPDDKKRFFIYLTTSLVVPVIIIVSSVIPDGIPDVPKSFIKTYSGDGFCSFGDVNLTAFFIPIGLLIGVAVIGLGYTSYIINTHNDPNDYEWIQKKSSFKFMLRSCFLIWLTVFIWLIEVVASKVVMATALTYAIDLIEALQGIFVAIIFVLNKYIRKEIRNVIYAKEHKLQQEERYKELLETLEDKNVSTAATSNNDSSRS